MNSVRKDKNETTREKMIGKLVFLKSRLGQMEIFLLIKQMKTLP